MVGRDGTALPIATMRSGCAGISKVPLSAVKERVPESSELQPASSRAVAATVAANARTERRGMAEGCLVRNVML